MLLLRLMQFLKFKITRLSCHTYLMILIVHDSKFKIYCSTINQKMNKSGKQRSGRRADNQIDYLIKFMANHHEFATSGFIGGDYKRKHDDQWEELTRALNELGNQKTSDQWKKMWRNEKACARKKNAVLKKYLNGNYTPKSPPKLTERQNLIISMIETSKGIGVGEAGFEDISEIVDTEENILQNPTENNLSIKNLNDEMMKEQDIIDVPSMNSVNSLKRPLDNDSLVSLSKIACCSTSGAQTKKKQSKVQKYSDLVKDTNDGLKDISLAIKENSKALNIMAGALNDISSQFKRMNDIFEHYVSNTVPIVTNNENVNMD